VFNGAKSSVPLRLLVLVLAIISASLTGHAQSSSKDSDDDANAPAFLEFSVVFSEDGTARVAFTTFGFQSSATEIKNVVESSLGCSLKDSPYPRADSFGYSGFCHPAFSRARMAREFRIATAPLRKIARDHQVGQLNLFVRMPDDEIAETQPPLKTTIISGGRFPTSLRRLSELNRAYFWKADGPIPDVVIVRFGLSSEAASRAAGILLAILMLPALLIFWMSRKALSSEAQDKTVVWFTYMRYLQWTLNIALIGWWVAADSLHLDNILKLLSTGTRFAPAWGYAVTPVLVNWVPPILVWILCFALSHPVQEKLRGLTWTRRELALQAFYSCCASLAPFAMVITGITSLITSSVRVALLWFLGAYAVRIVAVRAKLKFLGMQPHALTTGDLRDRAFEMARKLGVKLQQIYVIPSGKGQMANAFARSGNVISFTDFLLQRMTRREVDYVLGHELSHLKLGHPGKLALASVVSYFVALAAVGFADPFLHLSVVARYALIVLIVTLAPYFCSRRFEYSADAGAIGLTGDPQAAISALFKLAQLNMLPIHWSNWSEKWLTHPSSLRRAQAIALKAGIPAEHVQTIAQAATGSADSYYVLPATVQPGSKVHSTHGKQSGSLRTLLSMFAVIIFTPAVFALLAAHSGPNVRLRVALYLAGFAATIGMYYLFANFVPPMRLRTLASALKTKLAKEGAFAESWAGIPVGLSPAAAPRVYEANTNWDLGCLFVRADRICYCGEETKFSLRSGQLTAIQLAPGMPGMLPPWRIYFAWKDDERGTSGVFNIGCIDGSSTLQLRKETAKLAARLQAWWKSPGTSKPLPDPLINLTSPEIGAVTGGIPGKGVNFGKVLRALLNTAGLAAVGAVLCGLPFHLMTYLISAMNPNFARIGLPFFRSPGSGWYVVAVAVVMRLITMIPMLRYKDRAIVTIASSMNQRPGNSPREASHRENTRHEPNAVLTR